MLSIEISIFIIIYLFLSIKYMKNIEQKLKKISIIKKPAFRGLCIWSI